MSVKLHNIGQSSIEYSPGHYFKPNQKLEFSEEVGAKLQKLYPEKVHSLEDVMKAFEAAPAEEEPEPKKPAVPQKSGGKGDDKPAV